MQKLSHFHPCWGSLSRMDGHFRRDPVKSLSEQCGQCVQIRETRSMASTVSPLFTPHLLYSLALFSPFYVITKLSLLALFFAFWRPFLTCLSLSLSPLFLMYFSYFYRISIPTSSACPTCCRLPSLYTTPTPPHLCSPSTPHKKGYKSRGKFIRSKNKHVSVSVPCRVPQGCTVLWMALSVRLVWGPYRHSQHTHIMHTLSKGQSKAVITSILPV